MKNIYVHMGPWMPCLWVLAHFILEVGEWRMKHESTLTTASVFKLLVPMLKITVLEIIDYEKNATIVVLVLPHTHTHTHCMSDHGLSPALKNSRNVTNELVYLNVNQLDALNFIMSLFHASTCFEHMCSSSGGQNCTIQPLVSSHWNKWVVWNY